MIHKYKQNGLNIVLDVNSGAVHLFDDIAYDLLDFIDESNPCKALDEAAVCELCRVHNRSGIVRAYSEICLLYKEGKLFSKEQDVSQEILEKNLSSSPIKSMCLNVAHDCNLRCKYCFASTGDFSTGRELMSFSVAKAAIDFLLENSGARHNLEVDFFGGEPLLNFEVVKKTVFYARSLEFKNKKKFRFTLTTNGLLLTDEIIDFLNEEMSNVVLSLDGRKIVNDSLRATFSGLGSYDVIVPKFKKLVSKRKDKDYYVRGTFTKQNLDFSKDVLHINSLGFDQISVEPVVLDSVSELSIKEDDISEIKKEYEKLVEEIINLRKSGKFLNFFHFMLDFEDGPCAIKRLKGCGCGNEYIAVTPNGDIFPCHQFVGNSEWKMGNVLEDFSLKENLREKFIESNIFEKKDCNNCWAKFFCGGGCSANNFKFEKDIKKPYKMACELQKKRVECALYLKIKLAELKIKN